MKHTEEEYRIFFGHKSAYYLEDLRESESGKGSRFNLFAFIFGFLWMFYRKLYRLILIVFLCILLEEIVEQTIFYLKEAPEYVDRIVERISFFAYATIFGYIGNRSYIRMADRKISRIKLLGLSGQETHRRLQKAVGVTLVPHLFLLIVMALIITLGKQGYLSD